MTQKPCYSVGKFLFLNEKPSSVFIESALRKALRAGRCWGLCRRRHLLNLNIHVWIPAREDGT